MAIEPTSLRLLAIRFCLRGSSGFPSIRPGRRPLPGFRFRTRFRRLAYLPRKRCGATNILPRDARLITDRLREGLWRQHQTCCECRGIQACHFHFAQKRLSGRLDYHIHVIGKDMPVKVDALPVDREMLWRFTFSQRFPDAIESGVAYAKAVGVPA